VDYDGEAISTEQVNEDSCFTVSEAITFLEERGFSGVEVEASYDMSGTLLDDSSIAQSGSERYPSYYTAYAASDDSVWVIYIVGKTIMANPLQANLENDTYYLLSESNTVNTYIPAEGVFEVNVPDESKAIVKAVDRIDSTTLDNTTYSVIQEM
jgi:hypothetical protein